MRAMFKAEETLGLTGFGLSALSCHRAIVFADAGLNGGLEYGEEISTEEQTA